MDAGLHWAAELIGRPYQRGAEGPEAYSCWGLVRHVFRTQYGIEMPAIAVADPGAINISAIRHAARVSGWRPIDVAMPTDRDIVLMAGLEGPHVGVMILANGVLRLLHAIEGAGVCTQTLLEASWMGLRDFSFWRQA